MIDREQAEKALEFLADTDEEYAEAKVEVERAQFLLKRRESHAFLSSSGNNPERQAQAKDRIEVLEAEKLVTKHMVKYERLKAQRESARLRWEHFRSLLSARKQGMDV